MYSLMCSSSLDFPQEYTKDLGVIALCHKLRGSAFEPSE